MSAAKLVQLLKNYRSLWPREANTVSTYISFVESHVDCFERSQLSGHVTGSAWLVNDVGTHVLLTHHKKLNKWFQLGGHADGHSDVLEVALKEAREESGIDQISTVSSELFDIDIHEIPATKDEPAHLHYDSRFALQVSDTDKFTVSDESHALAWIKIRELDQLTDEMSMLRMADKWQRRFA
jgi:8-oxo-dGTP pyrophosphatase MutT (NUDIX family)